MSHLVRLFEKHQDVIKVINTTGKLISICNFTHSADSLSESITFVVNIAEGENHSFTLVAGFDQQLKKKCNTLPRLTMS